MDEIYITGTCKSCIYWFGGIPVGECHRYPKPYPCHQNHWCGEQVEDASKVVPKMSIDTLPVVIPKPKRGRPKKDVATI